MEQQTGVKEEELLNIPTNTSFFPECWSDDRRMGILLAEFRPRQLNIESYDLKMKFWKDLIVSYCIAAGSSVISISMLKQKFRRKGTVPYCLHTVLEDMLAKEELHKESKFKVQRNTGAFGFNLWTATKLIQAPLSWGYDAVIGNVIRSTNLNENENFIVAAVVQQHAKTIENIIIERNLQNTILKYEDLIIVLNETSTITPHGVEPALMLLENSNRLTKQKIVDGESSTIIIKFAGVNATAQPITSIEQSIYDLEQSEKRLMKDINMIENNISQTMDQVREYVKNGRKEMAKTYLKKKHTLEKHMQGKINALENLQCLLLKIHNSQSDKNIIDAYKLGTNALKNAYEAAGITINQLDETLDEMKDVLGQHNEMLSMIGTVMESDVDELELEQELGDLIDIKLVESKIDKKDIPAIPATPTIEQNISNLPDFDREIEKRLAALRVDVIEGHKSADHAQ